MLQRINGVHHINPSIAAVHSALENTCSRSWQGPDLVFECNKTALRQESENVDAHYYLGIAHHERGEISEAERQFRHVRTLQPRHVGALINSGATSRS